MAGRSQIGCRTDDCSGVLGSWVNGSFMPAGHLIGGRDWYVDPDGIRVRCSRCNHWSALISEDGRLRLVALMVSL